jgi:hypothetical protein
MHLEGRARLHLGAATDWLPRWLSFLVPFSIASTVFAQGYLIPPPAGYQNAPSTPNAGLPSWNAGQAAGQVNPVTGQINGQANGQLNGQPNGQLNGQPNNQLNGQANNGQPNNGQPNTAANGTAEGETPETTTPPGAAPVESLLQWGALHLRAQAGYQFLYASGINSQPGNSADTYTHTLSVGITAQIGPHVSLTYSPSVRFFSERNFHNTIDQFVSLSAGFRYGDWGFSLSQSYSRADEPLVETSSQTDEQSFSTGLGAAYQINDKVSLVTSGGINFTVLGYNGSSVNRTNSNTPPFPLPPPQQLLTDSQSYSGSEWLNYRFDQKLTGGVGVTVGYSEQNIGFRSLDEQYEGNVNWHPGTKLTVAVSGGMDDQQFLNGNAPDILTPVYSAGVSYQLFKQTSFSLSASRSVSASLFQSEVTESTQLGIGLQQRLLGKLQLSLGFGYGTSDYKDTTVHLATARSDESTSYNVGLGFPFLKHCNFGTFYEYTRNSSSEGGFGYSSSQVGATLGWAY